MTPIDCSGSRQGRRRSKFVIWSLGDDRSWGFLDTPGDFVLCPEVFARGAAFGALRRRREYFTEDGGRQYIGTSVKG